MSTFRAKLTSLRDRHLAVEAEAEKRADELVKVETEEKVKKLKGKK